MNLTTDSSAHKVLVIVGPTAVGKTELSLRLAEELNGEIVSSDSRQVYRFLNIGTAKPTPEELARAPHHFIDIRDPDQYYSAGEYGREARDCIDHVFQKNKTPIVVGGSGFYVQALVDGLFAPKLSDPQVKEKWRQRIRQGGRDVVFQHLLKVDPLAAERLHPHDEQRIVRALEVWELSGKPISDFRSGDEQPGDFQPVLVGLHRDREKLYRRIEARVDMMIHDGLVDEVEHLQKMGFGPDLNALRTVGYKEVFDFFAETISYDDMIDLVKRNTRRYAKRQLTWFRRDARINWISLDDQHVESVLKKIIEIFTNGE
jgi:tRNA dimethylallyltransferase